MKKQLVIIGGGPAGMSAAVAAYESGARDILILEREEALGGILRQCIHNGFGLHKMGRELTGPEYAYEYEKKVKGYNIPVMLNTTVISLSPDKIITAQNENDGIFEIEADAVVLAMGCRERSKGAINIPGTRPAGIYSAGSAQRLVNIKGYLPGRRVVILGSGDIGLIMARRMTLEGARVEAVLEIMPYPGGLARNIEQCLNDFNIPLYLSTGVQKIHGTDRVEGVTVATLDKNGNPIENTKRYIPCDTVLLSVGLIPENELSRMAGLEINPATQGAIVDQRRQSTVPGIFSAGNVLHVHDLVDFVSNEAEIAGKSAAEYLLDGEIKDEKIKITPKEGVRYTVPSYVSQREDFTLYFRVSEPIKNAEIRAYADGNLIFKKKKARFAPSEMESVKIKGSTITFAREIFVEVKK